MSVVVCSIRGADVDTRTFSLVLEQSKKQDAGEFSSFVARGSNLIRTHTAPVKRMRVNGWIIPYQSWLVPTPSADGLLTGPIAWPLSWESLVVELAVTVPPHVLSASASGLLNTSIACPPQSLATRPIGTFPSSEL